VEVQLRQIEQKLFEGFVAQQTCDVGLQGLQYDGPQSATFLNAIGRVLVHRANGVDEVTVVSDPGRRAVNLLQARHSESAEVRDFVFVCDGVDVDEVGVGGTVRRVNALAKREGIAVVNERDEDVGIIEREVEGGGVCFLRDQGGSGHYSRRVKE
jgi:hypothetical protein